MLNQTCLHVRSIRKDETSKLTKDFYIIHYLNVRNLQNLEEIIVHKLQHHNFSVLSIYDWQEEMHNQQLIRWTGEKRQEIMIYHDINANNRAYEMTSKTFCDLVQSNCTNNKCLLIIYKVYYSPILGSSLNLCRITKKIKDISFNLVFSSFHTYVIFFEAKKFWIWIFQFYFTIKIPGSHKNMQFRFAW